MNTNYDKTGFWQSKTLQEDIPSHYHSALFRNVRSNLLKGVNVFDSVLSKDVQIDKQFRTPAFNADNHICCATASYAGVY